MLIETDKILKNDMSRQIITLKYSKVILPVIVKLQEVNGSF
jgi:hypothetical protein